MENKTDTVIVEHLASVIPDAEKILSGNYIQQNALKWFYKVRSGYQWLYGTQSAPFVELNALYQGLMKRTADPALVRTKVNEFLALVSFLQNGAALASSVTVSRASITPCTRSVFVIHGHDELNQLRLQAMLKDQFSLEPVIMLEKPGRSSTMIDKFEEYAKYCTFAFALFTPDDLTVNRAKEYSQARPNVHFETGWFVGRLSKERVLILLKEGTAIHSDFEGVSRIQFKEDVNEAFLKIKIELEASGLI